MNLNPYYKGKVCHDPVGNLFKKVTSPDSVHHRKEQMLFNVRVVCIIPDHGAPFFLRTFVQNFADERPYTLIILFDIHLDEHPDRKHRAAPHAIRCLLKADSKVIFGEFFHLSHPDGILREILPKLF